MPPSPTVHRNLGKLYLTFSIPVKYFQVQVTLQNIQSLGPPSNLSKKLLQAQGKTWLSGNIKEERIEYVFSAPNNGLSAPDLY